MIGDPTPFRLTDPLPRGDVVLEASAGTGKTFTIAALVSRWVAETDLRLPDLLVVTFTRAATRELRDRVRSRLVATVDHLEAVANGNAITTGDEVLDLLGTGTADELAARRSRLARAISDVDVATISTIHGFCQHVLDGLGIASDLDRDAELVNDLGDLTEEVVDDLLLTTYLEPTELPVLSRGDLLTLGRLVVANRTTALAPRGPDDPTAGLRLHLAQRIREEVVRRARDRRLLSFDDLLVRLEEALRDPERVDVVRGALRDRYRVTLIDEFQDTDPVQWSIVDRALAADPADPDDGRALVLIGDPKQAIYAFRGADVHAYLDASREAARRHTLATSWRADAGLLTAFDALFGGAHFGHPEIPYRQVGHADGHDQPRLVGAPQGSPLRLRLVPRHPSLPVYGNKPSAPKVRELIASDLAADVAALLSAEPDCIARDRDGHEVRRDPLAPRDIAVLVRSNYQASLVQEALDGVDVPAVIAGVASVFSTPVATDWQRLLDALERPASTPRVRALALSAWVGWNGSEVAAATDRQWDDLHEDVHTWARILRERGVAAMFRSVLLDRAVRPRLLGLDGGERRLADLEHLAELVHAAAMAEHLAGPGLAKWLRERITEAGEEAKDERLRRLETDADAVQILTIHRSKGLEFAVVYCPFLWSSSTGVRGAPVFHDDDGRRTIDVGGETHADYAANCAAAEEESRGEELRLAYVAMTRAKHQVVAWYAPAGVPEWSGLGRLLLCRGADGGAETDREVPLLEDHEIHAAAEAIAAAADGTISVEEVPEFPGEDPWVGEGREEAALDRARFRRTLDDAWRRTSYTGLTRIDDPEPRVGSEPDESVKDDERVPDAAAVPGGSPDDDDPAGLRAITPPLAEMPGGTHVGTFVHSVMEHTDFAAEDLDGAIAGAVATARRRRPLDIDGDLVVTGLAAAIETPLGPTVGGISLRQVTRVDRRDEVEFELPLHRTGRTPTVDDIARLMIEHLPPDDPLVDYPRHLPNVIRERDLRGFLAGSIDLVLRRETDEGPVFHVADHKTNRLGIWTEPLTAWDYRPAALVGAMVHGHYPLQALLYSVALHRMLRWRLPDYAPARHLGSVLYLFLRGMTGADPLAPDGQPIGVFAWQPPAELVTATSDLLHGARS